MIKANELRIGNYILYLGEVYLVDGVKYEDGAPAWKYRITFKTLDGNLRNTKMENFIHPIPLTPEILANCGFVATRPGEWRLNDPTFFAIYDVGTGFEFAMEHDAFYGIAHLHELQNFYFVLAGQELQINL